jgi:hypothetical protein
MNSKLAIVALIALALSCCDEEEGPLICGYENPIHDLPWLKAKAEEIQDSDFMRRYFYIMQADYNGEAIFYVNNCCPTCDAAPFYYNCAGERIDPIDHSQVKTWKRIWAPEELECVFTD